jgi:hypothetical protein
MRTLLFAAVAALAISSTIESAHANRMYLGSGFAAYGSEIKGAAALIQLRVPFGGRDKERAQPRLTLAAGPIWQEQTDAFLPGRVYVIPSSEMGVSFRGDPVLRVGGIDLSDALMLRLMARDRVR